MLKTKLEIVSFFTFPNQESHKKGDKGIGFEHFIPFFSLIEKLPIG